MLQNKFVLPMLILFLTGLHASESNVAIVPQDINQVQAPNRYERMKVESEKLMAFFLFNVMYTHLLPKLPYLIYSSTAFGVLIIFAMDFLIHVVDQWINKFTGQFKKPVCFGLVVLAAGYSSILFMMYIYRFVIFLIEIVIPRVMDIMEMYKNVEDFRYTFDPKPVFHSLVSKLSAKMSEPSIVIDQSTDLLVKVFVTGMAVAIVFFPGIVLRWTVFAPVRFTSWVAHFPKVKAVLRWIVDNLAIFLLYSILSGVPVSLETSIPTIATSGLIHIVHKAFDDSSTILPEMRGKTFVVSGTKFLVSVYMFPKIFNAIDARVFHMYNWSDINGFKTPNLEIEGVLSQAKHDFETCKRMKNNWPYANPKLIGICDPYSRERLETDFRCINYFPKKGDITCKFHYRKCALKNHPDKKGTNDKLKLCTALKEQCEGTSNSCGEK